MTRGCYLGGEESRDDERMNERRTDYLVVVVDAVNDILSDEFEDAGEERRYLTYMVQAQKSRPSSSDALCAIQMHFPNVQH